MRRVPCITSRRDYLLRRPVSLLLRDCMLPLQPACHNSPIAVRASLFSSSFQVAELKPGISADKKSVIYHYGAT